MWNVRLAGQLANWRSTVVNTTGALGAVGVVLGGAGAVVVEGTTALVRGVMEGARREALTPENIPIPDEAPERHLKMKSLAKTTEDVQGSYASRRQGSAQGSRERAQSERGRKLELEFGEKRAKEKETATAIEDEHHC